MFLSEYELKPKKRQTEADSVHVSEFCLILTVGPARPVAAAEARSEPPAPRSADAWEEEEEEGQDWRTRHTNG